MLRYTLLVISFLFAWAFTSCKENQAANAIRVEGFVENLPDGKVYLTDAYDWQRVVDSATATNGHFAFELAPDTAFVPFLASVHYPDSTQKAWHYIKQLIYLNAAESRGKMVSGTSSFFLGPEGAIIKGRLSPTAAGFLTVAAGKDNELYQQVSGKGFGYINTRDPADRPGRLQYFKRLIEQHPTSYFLLKGILMDKEHYAKQELEDLLARFQPQVQDSRVGQDLRTYLANRTDPHAPYRNLVLADARQQSHPILDPKAKLNLLIFWASWCGPCRQEIPVLKQVYQAFHHRGLHMASISIDEDPRSWQKALGEEQMGWPQLVVPKDQVLRVRQQFNFRAIPLVILMDRWGNATRLCKKQVIMNATWPRSRRRLPGGAVGTGY
jgi:thiol-disulfide isomerase/thioredoxin